MAKNKATANEATAIDEATANEATAIDEATANEARERAIAARKDRETALRRELADGAAAIYNEVKEDDETICAYDCIPGFNEDAFRKVFGCIIDEVSSLVHYFEEEDDLNLKKAKNEVWAMSDRVFGMFSVLKAFNNSKLLQNIIGAIQLSVEKKIAALIKKM